MIIFFQLGKNSKVFFICKKNTNIHPIYYVEDNGFNVNVFFNDGISWGNNQNFVYLHRL